MKPVEFVGLEELEEYLNDASDDDYSSSYNSEDDSSFESSDDTLGDIPSESFRESKIIDDLKQKAHQRRMRRKSVKKVREEEDDTTEESSDSNDSKNLDYSIHLARSSGHRLPDLPDFTEDDEFSDFGEEDEEEVPLDWKTETLSADSPKLESPVAQKNELATTAA
jgi:hypothetical protein